MWKHDAVRSPVEKLTDLLGVQVSDAHDSSGAASRERLELRKHVTLGCCAVFKIEEHPIETNFRGKFGDESRTSGDPSSERDGRSHGSEVFVISRLFSNPSRALEIRDCVKDFKSEPEVP
ncbi:MAG: hypothetical protein RIS92_2649 [Verrucomicrobiota bacterium]